MEISVFEQHLKEQAEIVSQAVDTLLPVDEKEPQILHEAMRYSALAGGKRLRGVLLLEAASLGEGKVGSDAAPDDSQLVDESSLSALESRIVPQKVTLEEALAAVVEMVHTYSLIHDDLPCMDDDDFRRGKPSNHKVFGEGMAVLAGDALLTRAFEIIALLPRLGASDRLTVHILRELTVAAGTGGLIGGQVADLLSEGALENVVDKLALDDGIAASAEERLTFIHRHKTGALFRASLRLGALAGGLTGEALERVTKYAIHFGTAFQITDDLLDIEGEPDHIGKAVGSDARKQKLTYPSLYGIEKSRAMAEKEVEGALQALEPFGIKGDFLKAAARFVLRRDR